MRVDKFTLALMNRRLVLKTIWERGAINKAEIARRTGLSLPTAIKITDELLDNRIVRSCGRQEGASGKRPEMYEFAGDCYYSVGIDFAPTVLRALVMDLNGMPVAKANRPIPVPEDADAVIQTAAELIDQLLRESGIPLHRVLGVGVGVPGILDLDQGRVLFSPNFHWEDVALLEPLGRLLLQRTSIRWPMRLENSNRAMALGGITILSASTLAMASAQRPLKTESCASVPLGHQGSWATSRWRRMGRCVPAATTAAWRR